MDRSHPEALTSGEPASEGNNARERLIDCAVRLLHAGSYGAVSVTDLCHGAGVSKGSFYHFFPSKRDLACVAIDAQWKLHREGLYDRAFLPDVSPLERIRRFFKLLPEWTSRLGNGMMLGCPIGNLGVEMATQDEVIREKVRTVLAEASGYFARAIGDACESGQIEEVNVESTAVRVLAYLEGLYVLAKVENDARIFARLGEGAIDLLRGDIKV
jgi:TetR/AcrR family transcriptional repressor of nem operon